jgi:UDPglucose--hexose-1-phosphate uridylyltransferase
VSLFKNEGAGAGASIPHMHSQVMPLPFVPPRVQREAEAFAAGCPLCDGIDGSVLADTPSFTWLAPDGSAMPYQQWIVPKRHAPEMTDLTDQAVAELAALLQSASAAMLTVADSYNWMFMNFARSTAPHWYVELFPRVAQLGGFELGTGTFVEILDPALAAQRLREAERR